MIRVLTLFAILAAAVDAHAGLITHKGYTLNTDTSIVTGGGLEWLQWDETVGMSVNGVSDSSSMYYQDGWRVASGGQMAALFSHWGFGGIAWPSDENTYTSVSLGNEPGLGELESTRMFFELFGETQVPYAYAQPRRVSSAIFGNDLDEDGRYNPAVVASDVYQTTYGDGDGDAWMGSDHIHGSRVNSRYGVALVRSVNPIPVTSPSSLALLGIGLIGLCFRRRTL